MRVGSVVLLFLVLLSFSGCRVENTPLSLFKGKTKISTEEMNDAFAKVFPIKKKSSFGSVVLQRAILIPSRDTNKVMISLGFGLTSFEIPEGIDGVMTLSAGLRYDPRTKKIYFKEVTPVDIRFENASLVEYVSDTARSALKVIAMRELSDIELYQIKESFTAKFIKNITVHKGNIVIEYGF